MEVTDLLAQLKGVRGRNGAWSARCPAHEDRSPSLSVKELPDGRILMHCFGGCGTDAVLGALGVQMTDLFPEPLGHHHAPTRGFSATDALRCLASEGSIIALTAADIAEGKAPTGIDVDRVTYALGRINEALEFTSGA